MDQTGSKNHQWILWQLIDSALPVGGFAHSGGLEAAMQIGEIEGAAGVEQFIETSLRQFARAGIPFAVATREKPDDYLSIDEVFDVFLSSSVSNRASRAQGQALLAAAVEIWDSEILHRARSSLRKSDLCGHWPICFGLVAGALELSDFETIDALLYIHMRGLLSAAVRLNIIGPMEAQRIQSRLGSHRVSMIEVGRTTSMDEATQSAPILDLIQAQHDRLYSRLFIS